MGTLAVIVMIILFILLMAFVFSTALLTPLIGKKNLIFVIGLGFVVGIIGGAFFIAPVFDDIPGMTRSLYQVTSSTPEIITANISTDADVNQAISSIKDIEGVKRVDTTKITLKTTPIALDWQTSIKSRAKTVNSNITSIEIPDNETILVTTKPESNPPETIKNFKDWIMLVSGIDVRFSIVEVEIQADPSQVDVIVEKLPLQQAVVTKIKGPMEENVGGLRNALPNKNNIIIFCGFLGVLTGLAGVFIDGILQRFKDIRSRVKK